MGKKFIFGESPAAKVAEEIRDNHSQQEQPEQGRVEVTTVPDSSLSGNTAQPIPEFNQQMQRVAQLATPSTPSSFMGEGRSEGLVLKNVGAKIPYSIYDRLERIKRQSERSGIKADKRNIGDLIVQAIKEFVEKYDVQ